MKGNKKSSEVELERVENDIWCGDGLISKGFERVMARDGQHGYVKVSFNVEWSGYFIKKDFSEIIDDSIKQINDFLLSNEEGE